MVGCSAVKAAQVKEATRLALARTHRVRCVLPRAFPAARPQSHTQRTKASTFSRIAAS